MTDLSGAGARPLSALIQTRNDALSLCLSPVVICIPPAKAGGSVVTPVAFPTAPGTRQGLHEHSLEKEGQVFTLKSEAGAGFLNLNSSCALRVRFLWWKPLIL